MLTVLEGNHSAALGLLGLSEQYRALFNKSSELVPGHVKPHGGFIAGENDADSIAINLQLFDFINPNRGPELQRSSPLPTTGEGGIGFRDVNPDKASVNSTFVEMAS